MVKFLVKYKGRIETRHICHKPRHKSADCNKKFDKQWSKLWDNTDNRNKTIEIGFAQAQPPIAAQNQNQTMTVQMSTLP